MVLNLSYFLILIIEGCIGATGAGQVCNGQNFSVRVHGRAEHTAAARHTGTRGSPGKMTACGIARSKKQ